MNKDNARTVWSSDGGDQRKKSITPKPPPDPLRERSAERGESLPPRQQTAYLHRESGGRGGKIVSVVKNLVLSDDDMKSLAKKLKQKCGTGGTVKDGVIEIQGEHRQKMADVLQRLGYKVKIAGG
jgi:translation initiation factor 1